MIARHGTHAKSRTASIGLQLHSGGDGLRFKVESGYYRARHSARFAVKLK
jgi:hypothetical protein